MNGTDDDCGDVVALLRAWHQGDEHAFTRLIEAVTPAMRRHAHNLIGDRLRARLDTNDAVQEAIIGFFRDAPRFHVDSPEQLEAILRRIVQNVIRGGFRYWSRKRRDLARDRPVSGLSSILLDPTSPPAGNEDERDARVRLAIETLDPDDQRILSMRFYDELGYPEISVELSISIEATRKRYSRAFGRLERKVRQLESGDTRGFWLG